MRSFETLNMGRLFDTIRRLVIDGRYIVGAHAAERLDERGVLEWQVIDGVEHATCLAERPDDKPNPAIEVRETLADGTDIAAVWSHVILLDVAKLVTVYFLDE